MPYSGVPEGSELEKKIERCVESAMTDDPELDKSAAIAICRDSIENKGLPMISQTKEGKYKVKGYDDEFDSGPDAVTFMRSMMTQKRKEALAQKGIYGPTSFEELDEFVAAQEKADRMYWLNSDFMWLVDNAMWDPEVDDKATAVRQLANEFGDRLDNLAAETETAMKSQSFTDKVKDIVQSILPKKKEPKNLELATDSSSLKFYKSGDDLKWVATYSNNLRDDDHPAEIISSQSHKKHVALVKAGLVNPPDLWLWHEPDWSWGVGEWVTYDEHGDGVVFTHAGGTVKKGFEELAEVVCGDNWGVSHGMPIWSVSHSKDDPTVITEHITEEVSPLPMWAAANKFTSFSLNKEDSMIPKEEKARLMADGISEDLLNRLEQSSAAKAQKAQTQGRQHKEAQDAEPTPEPEAEVVEEPTADAGDGTGTAQPATPAPAVEEGTVSIKEADLAAIIKSVTTLGERVSELTERVANYELASDNAVAKKAAETPLASLLAHMVKAVSPIDNPQAAVDGRTTLAKNAPEETEPDPPRTGIPMIDGFLNGSGGTK